MGNYLQFTLRLHRYFQVEKQRFTYNTVPEGVSVNMRGPEKFVP